MKKRYKISHYSGNHGSKIEFKPSVAPAGVF